MTNSEIIKAWASILDTLAWPFAILVIALMFRRLIYAGAVILRLKIKEIAEFSVEPAQGIRPPSSVTGEERSQLTSNVGKVFDPVNESLPLDYYFLNHTSFLRIDRQEEFQKRTGVPRYHYDIRVIVDSYYQYALEKIERVEYILHRAYPNPYQVRTNLKDKFLLKELANGEYVLMAKVFVKDRKDPILLQRYITLWKSGPELP